MSDPNAFHGKGHQDSPDQGQGTVASLLALLQQQTGNHSPPVQLPAPCPAPLISPVPQPTPNTATQSLNTLLHMLNTANQSIRPPTPVIPSQPSSSNISNLLSFLSQNNNPSSIPVQPSSSLLEALAPFQNSAPATGILKHSSPEKSLKDTLRALQQEQQELEETLLKQRQALVTDHEQRRSQRAAQDILSHISSTSSKSSSSTVAEKYSIDEQTLFDACLYHELVEFDRRMYRKMKELAKSQRQKLVHIGAPGFIGDFREDHFSHDAIALQKLL